MRVYLAGPINACSDAEVTEWRDKSKARLSDYLDPAERDFRGVENETYVSIVEGDKDDIIDCDAMLAYCWQPSYGTAMEILFAFEQGVPVYAVVPEGLPVSPWVQYHAAQVFRSLDEALDSLS